MSASGNPPPPRIPYTGGQIAMLVIGGLLLLPGLCSILFAIGMLKDLSLRDPIAQMILSLWGICLAISAVGVLLIVLARRRARRAR